MSTGTIRYQRLTRDGDESKDVDIETAQSMAAADLYGDSDDPKLNDYECPDPARQTVKRIRLVKIVKQIVKKVKQIGGESSPKLLMQKKKGKDKQVVVQKPSDIDENTEKVMAVPEPRAG